MYTIQVFKGTQFLFTFKHSIAPNKGDVIRNHTNSLTYIVRNRMLFTDKKLRQTITVNVLPQYVDEPMYEPVVHGDKLPVEVNVIGTENVVKKVIKNRTQKAVKKSTK